MKNTIIGTIIVAAVIAYLGVFQINEIEQGIVTRFGDPIRVITEPGLKFKVPFVDKITRFDNRLLEYDASPREIITRDKKTLVVDNYAKWRIEDPLLFLKSVGNKQGAQARLDDIIYSELRERMGQYNLIQIVSTKRNDITKEATLASDEETDSMGIKVLDVRIKRADLPQQNEVNVYERMRAERQQQSKKYRAEGQEEATEIRSQANKERTIILAEAYRKAKTIRGEGDAEALEIYANAFNQDKEFYKFVRTLDSYKKILKGDGKNNLILSTDSDVWKLLNNAEAE
ncbi:MAG: protease modulator HflC [Fusobacteriota bacterium]